MILLPIAIALVAHFGFKLSGLWTLLAALIGFVCILLAPSVFQFSIYRMTFSLNNLDKILIALIIVGWPGYTRVIRGEILKVKQEDYVEAAKAVGCSDLRIMIRHILPNSIYPILVIASLDIGSIVLLAAALSFLGIGAPLGYADWGQLISLSQEYIWNPSANPWRNWHTFVIPGIFIVMFTLGWNLLGDAFRDILDPTLRRK
jgi:peptide/nickel transport system permease protein